MNIFNKLLLKKSVSDFDFSKLRTDMHSHLIPGIDDGSTDMESTIIMLRKFQDLGYKKVITTPHIKTGVFDNTSEIILAGFEDVKAEILKQGISIEFEAAAEYFYDFSFMERIEKDDILSFSNKHVLLEYSFNQPPMGENEMYFALQMKQYKPILAHFERYPYYHGSVKRAQELRDKGVKIQVNLLSLFGHYGPEVQKQTALLIKENQVDLFGSDCHRIEHLELLEKNRQNTLLSKSNVLRLFNSEL
jgi:tyrosine-protein phosphatase YwqE